MVKKPTDGRRKRIAWLLVGIGAAAAVVGAWLIYIPAAIILGGAALGGLGLFAIEVGDAK